MLATRMAFAAVVLPNVLSPLMSECSPVLLPRPHILTEGLVCTWCVYQHGPPLRVIRVYSTRRIKRFAIFGQGNEHRSVSVIGDIPDEEMPAGHTHDL